MSERERLHGRRTAALSTRRHVHCPACDVVVIEATDGHVTIRAGLPLEFVSRPGEPGVLLACGNCGTLVPIEPDLLLVA